MLLFSFVKYYSQCQITASRILIYHNLKTAKIFDLINLQFTPAHYSERKYPKVAKRRICHTPKKNEERTNKELSDSETS